VHLFLRTSEGNFAARQAISFVRLDMTREHRKFVMRGHSRPHLIDWNGDGKTDLVLADSLSWNLQVGAGPLVGKTEVEVSPFAVDQLPERNPYDYQFCDWDGDGRLDLLFAAAYLNDLKTQWLYDIYWCRNASRDKQPRFERPVKLLPVPAQTEGWHYDAFAPVDRGSAGRQDLVVSVSKDWNRKTKGGWTNKSELVLYRRR